jgi:import inner membrane translocase subunit TIM54
MQGQIPGSVARILLARFKLHRLEEAANIPRPKYEKPPSGIALVGRNTLKEYLWALKKGYLDEIDLDRESRIANGDLEEIESLELAAQIDKDGLFPAFVPTEEQPPSTRFLPEASSLPPQPPLLLLPYSHPLGTMLWWPKKLTNWLFGERKRVEEGAKAAFTLLAGQTREIRPPASTSADGLFDEQKEMARVWLNEDNKMAIGKGDEIWTGQPCGSEDLDLDLTSERYITSVSSHSRSASS